MDGARRGVNTANELAPPAAGRTPELENGPAAAAAADGARPCPARPSRVRRSREYGVPGEEPRGGYWTEWQPELDGVTAYNKKPLIAYSDKLLWTEGYLCGMDIVRVCWAARGGLSRRILDTSDIISYLHAAHANLY
jgi:hypothetical protein